MRYVNGKFVEERVVDCFKTSGVQGTFSIDQQPDIVWQERMRKEAAEPHLSLYAANRAESEGERSPSKIDYFTSSVSVLV